MAVAKVSTTNTGFPAAEKTQLAMLAAINANADLLAQALKDIEELKARPF